jgi:hypothetical protein
MTRISAAENIIIHTQPDRWQLLVNTDFVDTVQGDGVLLEAAPGQPLHFTTAFARSRRLPKSGQLSTQYVRRVVLGWSEDDEAWHLGLLFDQALADARGSRWCELAVWPDPEQDIFRELAVEAGRNLAQQVACPFNIVPISSTSRATLPKRPPMPLPDPPIDLQGWQFQRQSNGWLALIRDRKWARERLRRVFWYSLWVVIYIALAVATILSDIALPRPEWLPYLGLATALLLVGLVIYSLYELTFKPRCIVIDPQTRQIWGVISSKDSAKQKPIWRMSREQVDSVYVSQVVKPQRDQAIIQYGEINLRLTSGDYYYLISQDEAEPLTGPTSLNGTEAIVPLENAEVQTGLQIAGAHIGKALEVPVWYDHRGK